MMYSRSFKTPVGIITAYCDGDAVTGIKLVNASDAATDTELVNEKDTHSHPLLIETERQLQEYFLGKRRQFDLELNLKGTEFQRCVWQTLLKIPYGDTISYKSLAIMVDNKNAYRAVAMANHRNPVPIIVPCHRVISADGSLGGYAFGTALKQHLLDIERGVLNE